MKLSTKLLSAAVLMATSSIALAATQTSAPIEINVTKSEYAVLTGTAITTTTHNLSEAAVDNATVSLGTLGAESNVLGGCTMAFASEAGFKLELGGPLTSSEYLHDAGVYTVQHANDYSTNCNQVAADLSLVFPEIPPTKIVAAGTYSDLLRITVTTNFSLM